jgi:carbon storage regulator
MLVLSRKVGEGIQVGPDITIMLVRIGSEQVRIGIEAPPETRILRGELVEVAAGGKSNGRT